MTPPVIWSSLHIAKNKFAREYFEPGEGLQKRTNFSEKPVFHRITIGITASCAMQRREDVRLQRAGARQPGSSAVARR
jgi:hypothetical protein